MLLITICQGPVSGIHPCPGGKSVARTDKAVCLQHDIGNLCPVHMKLGPPIDVQGGRLAGESLSKLYGFGRIRQDYQMMYPAIVLYLSFQSKSNSFQLK